MNRHTTLVSAGSFWLGLTPLFALFSGFAWIFPAVIGGLFVHGAGALGRARDWPEWARVSSILGGMVGATTLLTAAGHSLLVVPLPSTFTYLAGELGAAWEAILYTTTPAPFSGPVMTLTIVAMMALMGLHELLVGVARIPVLTAATLFPWYTVVASVTEGGVFWLWFIVPAVGFLWVLAADNLGNVDGFGPRFRGRGRPVLEPGSTPMGNLARLIAVPIVLTALVFVTAVGIPTHGLLNDMDRFLSPGGGAHGAVSDWSALSGSLREKDPVDLLSFETEDEDPPYLRMHVADRLTADGFAAGDVSYDRPASSVEFADSEVDEVYSARIENLGMYDDAVPLPLKYRGLDLPSDWRDSAWSSTAVSSGGDLSSVSDYSFEYGRATPSARQLNDSGGPDTSDLDAWERYLRTPDLPELDEITAGVVEDEETYYGKIRAILDHFRPSNGFSYELETGPAGDREAVLAFLEDKEGFCQQYASAMGWMLRSAEIPSRVVIGLTPGQRDGDRWLVTSQDYHAWVEVFFPGYGWLPFDPTPSSGVRGSQSFEWERGPMTEAASDDIPDSGSDVPTDDADAPRDEGDEPEGATDDAEETVALVDGRSDRLPWGAIAAAAALTVLLAALAAVRPRRRHRRLRGDPTPANVWAELMDSARDLGLSCPPGATPRTLLASWGEEHPGAVPALELLRDAVERDKYAPDTVPADPALGGAALTAIGALRESATPLRRLWAAVFAATTFSPTRSGTPSEPSGRVLAGASPQR
ncbi:transglutaminase family protein [Salininema proteolyticum]|uniref:TransglutaminaseTgpA domain-containing protein n=1 Tax=Salininema proteolyticum TaxID=1607685 RepID=A0ABV8TYH8_9ACTN